jgi:hypothetical protein
MSETMLRFMGKVEPDLNAGCWLWSGAASGSMGYGYFRLGRETKAHRASWILHKGDIPAGLCVCHRCDVPACVNPSHLWLGTYADNNRDRSNKKRGSRGHKRLVRTFGEIQSRAKLTNEQVVEIRASSEPRTVLAVRYGVDKETIGRVRNGKARTKDDLGKVDLRGSES